MIKKLTALIGLLLVVAASVSCTTTDAKVGLPIPFTDPSVRVNLETQVTPLPPRICVGLDIVED